jgi:7-dehydrocholesterol reductase
LFAGLQIKKFITCRFGMMSWGLILLSYAAKQQSMIGYVSNSMLISGALQLFYIAKFYYWETGYLRSLDIMHDRAGFYICWGCMVWVPCVYTSPSMYLVLHPITLSTLTAVTIFGAGCLGILINYLADRQRQHVRATEGNCTVWGKKPLITLATYQTEQGETKQNIILASGWWGIARHFHYIPEILGAFCWSVPALFSNFSPYFYVIFLTGLLVDRAFRDDKRCAKKYGDYWRQYCELVPYKIVPFLI